MSRLFDTHEIESGPDTPGKFDEHRVFCEKKPKKQELSRKRERKQVMRAKRHSKK